jgi:hypothetical protein
MLVLRPCPSDMTARRLSPCRSWRSRSGRRKCTCFFFRRRAPPLSTLPSPAPTLFVLPLVPPLALHRLCECAAHLAFLGPCMTFHSFLLSSATFALCAASCMCRPSVVLSAAQRRKNVSRLKLRDFLSDVALAFDLTHDLAFACVPLGAAHALTRTWRVIVPTCAQRTPPSLVVHERRGWGDGVEEVGACTFKFCCCACIHASWPGIR